MFGCGSTNLANHLDQERGMDMEERKRWLKWCKIGVCVSRHSEEANKEFNIGESLENTFQRMEEMERNL